MYSCDTSVYLDWAHNGCPKPPPEMMCGKLSPSLGVEPPVSEHGGVSRDDISEAEMNSLGAEFSALLHW